jgi:Uma2 family endonuclease
MATVTTRRKARKGLPAMPPPPDLPLYRFSVEQYHQMIRAGVLREGERAELLEGWIVPKMTQNPPHPVAIQLLEQGLASRLPAGWIRRTQAPITTRDSEPEPDVSVVRGPARRYLDHHPRPDEIALVVEVADSSLAEDRAVKGRLYARARLPVYWIVNLVDSQIEVYTDPRGGRSPAYRRRQDYAPGDAVPLLIGGEDCGAIPVRDLLP